MYVRLCVCALVCLCALCDCVCVCVSACVCVLYSGVSVMQVWYTQIEIQSVELN